MRLYPILRLLPVAVIAATFASCALAEPSAPSTSSPPRTTDTFSGSLTYRATISHQFTVNEAGLVEISLTALGPLSSMAFGISVGTWSGSACNSATVANEAAKIGVTALSGTATAGTYCVNVYDSGNLPSDWTATYTVTVTHP